MTTPLYLDTETFSEADLKSAGTHRYAEHPSTEIMIAQWALGDAEPVVEDLTARKRGEELTHWLHEKTTPVVLHNSHFDRTLMRHVWGVKVDPERIIDTMVQAMAHGLPGGLDKIGAALNIDSDQQKDKRGKQLIQLFCKPRPKNMKERRATRWTHPDEWDEFLEYSRQDIVAMRAIHQKLPKWNYRIGHPEHNLWCLDQRVNDRGICIDLDLAHAAVRAVDIEKARLKHRVQDATDGLVSGPSKRDDMLFYILAEYGVDLPDMRADTLRRRLEDPELPEGVKLLISLRLEATKTSTAKYQAVINSASADGRVRNTTQFAGAQRTTRWAGRILQPHNMPRPDMGHMADHFLCSTKDLEADDEALVREYEEQGVAALKGGFANDIFTDVMALTSNLVRGLIIAPPHKKLAVADLSNIEGRGLAYLGNEEWKLKAFRDFDQGKGPDLYKLAYARAFNTDPKDATGYKRQIGKVMELGLGYEGGVAAFITFAAVYKMDLAVLADAVHSTASKDVLASAYGMHEWATKKKRTLGLERNVYVACEALKAMWRTAHPATKQLWADASEAVKLAIANPKEAFPVGRHIKVQVDGSWLRVRLPSGRYLCYLAPRVAEDGQISYLGVNQYTRQWARIKSYGGKFIENWDQAWARDVLANGMQPAENEGYEIVLHVHDELVTEVPDSDAHSADRLAEIMATPPKWAPDAPLAAAGFETKRYHK